LLAEEEVEMSEAISKDRGVVRSKAAFGFPEVEQSREKARKEVSKLKEQIQRLQDVGLSSRDLTDTVEKLERAILGCMVIVHDSEKLKVLRTVSTEANKAQREVTASLQVLGGEAAGAQTQDG
jgi:hypothetical protein